jgi:hypothetical protein
MFSETSGTGISEVLLSPIIGIYFFENCKLPSGNFEER